MKSKQFALSGSAVELIGGPQCGITVNWPSNDMNAHLRYYGGTCTYAYEGNGKATYISG